MTIRSSFQICCKIPQSDHLSSCIACFDRAMRCLVDPDEDTRKFHAPLANPSRCGVGVTYLETGTTVPRTPSISLSVGYRVYLQNLPWKRAAGKATRDSGRPNVKFLRGSAFFYQQQSSKPRPKTLRGFVKNDLTFLHNLSELWSNEPHPVRDSSRVNVAGSQASRVRSPQGSFSVRQPLSYPFARTLFIMARPFSRRV